MDSIIDNDEALTIRYQGNAGSFLSQALGHMIMIDVILYDTSDQFEVFFLGTGTDVVIVG